MSRITIAFEAEQFEWVTQAADEYDRSKAEIVRAGVDVLRGVDSPAIAELVNDGELFTTTHGDGDTITVNHGESITTDHHTDRIDDLEQRVADLEQRLDADRPPQETEPGREAESDDIDHSGTPNETRDPKGGAGGNHGVLSDTSDVDEILAEWNPGRSKVGARERRRAGRAVLEWLREQSGPQTRSSVIDALFDTHALEEQSEDTFWRKTARPAIQRAAEAGAVRYREGRHDYEWIGPASTEEF